MCGERAGEEPEHVSILTHQREERKQQHETERFEEQEKRLKGRKRSVPRPHLLLSQREENNSSTHPSSLVPHLVLSPSAVPDLLPPCSLLEQHQRLRHAGEDAGDDGKDEEMTSVWDRPEWCVDECVWESRGSCGL